MRLSKLTQLFGRRRPGTPDGGDLPWRGAYPAGVDWAAPIAETALYQLMADAVSRFGDRPCLDFLDREYTYAEVGELVDRVAKGFRQLGVEKGMRVGLCLPNSPYYVICFFAVLKAGGTVVNYNPLYTEPEIARQIADSRTRIMVTLDLRQLYPKVAACLAETPLRTVVVCPMGDILPTLKGVLFAVFQRSRIADIPDDLQHVSFDSLTQNDGELAAAPVEPGTDIAVLQYTGGTTGTPKGAMLTHANCTANVAQIRHWFPELRDGEESILAVLPFFHVFAMTAILNLGMAIGARLILLPRFELDEALDVIEEKRPTLFPAVPTLYTAINGKAGIEGRDLSSIRYCISGGAPLPGDVRRAFESLTGCILVEGYGLTEASPVVACNPLAGAGREGSIGLPLPGTRIEVRDLEDPARRLGVGEKGEICISGPQVMAGYLDRPEETADVLKDGFLRTGDVGHMDEDGFFFLVDRIKDLIICSGYNVYPRMIEEAIHLHPDVAEATVIGIPDAYRGQTPKAFVKLRDGAMLDEEGLLAFLKERLSPIEIPDAIEFRDKLPKTLIGKLSKKELADEANTEGRAGARP